MLKPSMFVLGALALITGNALAGVGFGDNSDANNNPIKQQTFYAGSPSGLHSPSGCYNSDGTQYDASGAPLVPTVGAKCDSGAALQKFVDPLPGLAMPGGPNGNGTGKYIPLAVATKWGGTNDDYFEIAVVEFSEKFHSSLAKATTLRGYVQIDPNATATGVTTDPTGKSKALPLFNPDGSSIRLPNGNQAYGFDVPHYLGPVIVANRGVATRLKFYNLLPVGRAAGGQRNGDLFLPVDETLPGAGFGPDGLVKYTQNRAEIHLHGGDNPWISDGTPHQWITPAGEKTAVTGVYAEALGKGVPAAAAENYLRGVSTRNVPDMPDPGSGAVTYYFPNGESARLMFYHDHSFGLTRLNVYAGEAAGYLLNDPLEQALVASGKLPADQVPLIIQDKGFVPKDIAIQDAKWDEPFWGVEADLWFPHVYETNQDPSSGDGTKPVGRWDWGPYFWPVFPSYYDRLPSGGHELATQTVGGISVDTGLTEVSTTPEAFMDTPIVNGAAYPKVTVEPKAYRFRFLNASNDRFMNMGIYVAADKETIDPNEPRNPLHQPTVCDGTSKRLAGSLPAGSALVDSVPQPADCTEVKMVYFDHSYPTSYYGLNSTLTFPTAGGLLDTGWGDPTGHLAIWSGVPDPTTVGPDIHMIGNEGGILPNLVSIPSTPSNYEANRRSVTVMNVLEHGLYLSTAGRADTVIDFSQYAGKTLILLNDAPAPVPASDPRVDYYTGMGDYSTVGGHENVKPGYGPNTRTVMQIYVQPTMTPVAQVQPDGSTITVTPPTTAFNVAALAAEIPVLHAATQPKPIVPETAFNAAWPNIATQDTFARIYNGSIYLGKFQGLTFTTPEAMKYTEVPRLADGSICTNPTNCAANLKLGAATALANTPVTVYIENKAIQELFEPTYGRMNATLGVELPFTSALTQTTIPLGYVDPATEKVADGETQFWKITHNGVDTHPVHFHLVNVQVINRIGWDGTIKPVTAAENGWKETVIMNPLEDVVVAVRAKAPKLPFGLMNSMRLRDPSQAQGVMSGFTQINPANNAPAVTTNEPEDFGWEYVWHCHILGHEENDFMRAMVFKYSAVLPDAPVLAPLVDSIVVPTVANPVNIVLNWTDGTPWNDVNTLGNAKNEVGFKVMRTMLANNGSYPAWVVINLDVNNNANTTTFTDSVTVPGTYKYRLDAYNPAGASSSVEHVVNVGTAAPQMFAVTDLGAVANAVNKQIDLAWTDLSASETAYRVERCIKANGNGGNNHCAAAALPTANATQTNRWFTVTSAAPANVAGGATAYADVSATLLAGTRYVYRVTPLSGAIVVAASNLAQVTTPATTAAATTVVNSTTLMEQVLTFPAVPGVTAYNLTQTCAGTALQCVSAVANPVVTVNNITTATSNMSAPGVDRSYTYVITPVSPWMTGSATKVLVTPRVPGRPNFVAAPLSPFSGVTERSLILSWLAGGGVANNYEVQQCTGAIGLDCPAASLNWANAAGTLSARTYNVTGLLPNTGYLFRVRATNPWGMSGYRNSFADNASPAKKTLISQVQTLQVVGTTANTVTLSWINPNSPTTITTVKAVLNTVTVGTVGAITTDLATNVSSVTITGLKPALTHTFTVSVTNANGTAPSINANTAVAGINFGAGQVVGITSTGMTLAWVNPNGIVPTVTVSPTVTPADMVVTTTGATFANLIPNTAYTVTVTVGAQSPQSVTQVTPSAPIGTPVVSNLTGTSLTLTWTNTNAGALPVVSGGGTVSNVTATSADITGLTPNTAYTFTVTAAGQSAQVSTSTPAVAIGTPVVSNLTGTSLTLTWTNTNGGALPIVSGGGTAINVTATSADVTGLIPNTAYTFTVTAAGQTAAVSVSTLTAAVGTPVVSNLTGTSLTLTWTNTNGGALPIVSGGGTAINVTATSADVTGLIPNTAYIFTVTAAGQAPTVPVTTLAVAVASLNATVIGSTAVDLSWTNPNGGGATAAVTVSPAEGVVAYTVAGASVTGLTPNTAYTFTVTVAGQVATVGPVTTTAILPVASNVGAVISGTNVVVQWNDNATGETRYGVQVKLSTDTVWTSLSALATFTGDMVTNGPGGLFTATIPLAVIGMTVGSYEYRVVPVAGSIVGTFSVPDAASTIVVTSPPGPVLIVASNVSATIVGGDVVVSWIDNAYGETRYGVQVKLSTDIVWTSLSALATFTGDMLTVGPGGPFTATIPLSATGMLTGNTYEYRVVPVAGSVVGTFSVPDAASTIVR